MAIVAVGVDLGLRLKLLEVIRSTHATPYIKTVLRFGVERALKISRTGTVSIALIC